MFGADRCVGDTDVTSSLNLFSPSPVAAGTDGFYWLACLPHVVTERSPSVLSRRAFVAGGVASTLVPAAIATSVTPAAAASVPANAPRVIHVPAGRTFRATLGDGDSLSDLVIDVRALGAGYAISATGSNWEVRNLAIVGRHPGSDNAAFAVRVTDPDGIGVIENVWLGDGSRDTVGIFVSPTHAGTLLIRRCHVARYPNNGIYASAPGNSSDRTAPGAGGRVRIEHSYAYNNAISGFRLGSHGSWVRDSAVVQDEPTPASIGGDATRAIWVYYESALVENVSFRMADGTGIAVGNGSWEKSTTEVTLRNVRGTAEDLVSGELGDVRGRVRQAPEIDVDIPQECPETPAEVFAAPADPLPAVGNDSPTIERPDDPAWIPALFGAVGAVATSVFGPVFGLLFVLLVLLAPGLAVLAVVLLVLYRRGDWELPEWSR